MSREDAPNWNEMKDEDIIKYLKKHKHCNGLYCFECPVYDTDECIWSKDK